jgi:hypothetical protein
MQPNNTRQKNIRQLKKRSRAVVDKEGSIDTLAAYTIGGISIYMACVCERKGHHVTDLCPAWGLDP